jgi:orotate phosphoribosyltransferase
MGPIFNYNKYKLGEETKEFFKIPFVFKTSTRLLRAGIPETYYIDFDLIINDPYRCEEVAKLYAANILDISREDSIDLLGFLEKSGGGTSGAIRLAGFISSLTHIPNVLVRLARELEYEQIKLPPIEGKTLRQRMTGMKVAIVTDHITTGMELLDAVDAVEYNGGKVINVIAYTMRTDLVRKTEFTSRQVRLISLHPLPDGLPEELRVRALEAVQMHSSSR